MERGQSNIEIPLPCSILVTHYIAVALLEMVVSSSIWMDAAVFAYNEHNRTTAVMHTRNYHNVAFRPP